jgi:ligand-binding sensor domain-containing protein
MFNIIYRMALKQIKINLYLLLYCYCTIGSTGLVCAQTIVSNHYSVNDGLPSSECYWMMQDSKHFLWIATDAGIVKYDGYHFTTYNSSKGLPDNTVFKIHEDRYGRIWFSSYSGKMAYYNHKTDSIYTIPANEDLSNIVKTLPVDFCFDNQDTLWISLYMQGYVKLTPPYYKDFKAYSAVQNGYYIKEVERQQFIYGADIKDLYPNFHLKFLDKKNKVDEFTATYRNFTLVGRLSAIQLNDTSYLLSSGGAVFKIRKNSDIEMTDLKLKENAAIISMYKDTKNRIWLCTKGNGLLVYQNEKFTDLQFSLFPNDIITNVLEDADHGFWISTTNNGVYHIPSLDFKFYNKQAGLSSDKVYDIAISDDKLYCTVDDGKLNILDLNTQQFQYKSDVVYNYIYGCKGYLIWNNITTQLYNLNKKSITDLVKEKTNGKLSLKKVIHYDSSYLLGFDPSSNIYLIHKSTAYVKLLVKLSSKVFSIYRDRNKIYIGTKQGLYKFENEKLLFLGTSNPMLCSRVEDIVGVKDVLFIATKGFGVLCYKDNKIMQYFNETNGLASDICKCIFKDNQGNIWVGTNKGISRLSLDGSNHYVCQTLNLLNGLVSNEINQILEYQDRLYFATNSGIGTFKINIESDTKKAMPVYIESFSVNNEKFDFSKIQVLSYNQNFINIQYKAIYLKNRGDILYRYKLEGLDTSWTYSKHTFVQFTTLPSGQYHFLLQARGNDLNWSSAAASLNFQIKKPFWNTWWFVWLLILSAFGLIAIIYQRRIAHVKDIEAQKTESNIKIAASELKALRSQMNPHFIFNAINSIQNFVIKNESVEAQKYLTKFSKLIRSVLENSKQEIVLLQKEIESLNLYLELEALRASFSFDYCITVDEGLKNASVYIPTMLIQPYIENAILHGVLPLTERRGIITIDFDSDTEYLICKIKDNGIGRQKAIEIKQKKYLDYHSMGMSVANDRILNLNKYTQIQTSVNIIDLFEKDLPCGTQITIKIKMI